MTQRNTSQTTLDRVAGSVSRSLAERLTRRSAISKVARYGVALSLGSAGTALLDDQRAWAAVPCTNGNCPSGCCGCVGGCCRCDSAWCGLGGVCPSGTCRCGAWWAGCYCSNGARLVYGDCCGGCGGGAGCTCWSSGCNGGPCHEAGGCSPCPGCCHQLQWYTDPNRECGTCNSGSPWYISCRRAFCES